MATKVTGVLGFISLLQEPWADHEYPFFSWPTAHIYRRDPNTPPSALGTRLQEQTLLSDGQRALASEEAVEAIKKSTRAFKSKALSMSEKTLHYSSCSLPLLHQVDGRWFN